MIACMARTLISDHSDFDTLFPNFWRTLTPAFLRSAPTPDLDTYSLFPRFFSRASGIRPPMEVTVHGIKAEREGNSVHG